MSEDQGVDYGKMTFTTRRFALAQLAEWALVAVPAGATLTVNGCFKVTVAPDRLCLAATDQQMSIFAESPAVSTQSEGEVFIPAKKLRAMLGEAPDGDVTVAVKGSLATVTAGTASWTLKLPRPDGYIGLPDLSEVSFSPANREQLLTALQAVRHAVGKDAGRPSFTQVRIEESGGRMYATAVDSSQFARAPVPGFPLFTSIPGAALDNLVKLLSKSPDDVEAADTGKYVVFRVGPVTLAALKMSASFPDVDSLFLKPAQGNDKNLGVDKAELAKVLRRVRINSDAITSAVALIVDRDGSRGLLTVASRDQGGNSAEETIPASWDGDGRQLLVVNAGHLEAMLAVHSSATCEFKVGKERGRVRPPLLLEDTESGVTGSCPQMPPAVIGY